MDVNGRLKDLNFMKVIPFWRDFWKILSFVIDGTEGHEAFYVSKKE